MAGRLTFIHITTLQRLPGLSYPRESAWPGDGGSALEIKGKVWNGGTVSPVNAGIHMETPGLINVRLLLALFLSCVKGEGGGVGGTVG